MEKVLINVLFPVYSLILFGFLVGRANKNLTTETISYIVLYLFAPVLVFNSFRKITLSLGNVFMIFLSAFTVLALVFLLSFSIEKLFFKKRSEAFELSATVMNSGYMGIPLIYLLLGEKALPYALSYMVATSVFHFSVGIAVLEGSSLKKALRSILKIPLLPALFLSFLFKSFHLPEGIEKTLELTGNATLPLMLVSIGINLSRVKGEALTLGLKGSAVRFLGGTASALFVALLFPLSPLAKKVIIVQSSLPSAILNYVLCERFNKNPEIAATIIFVSTLLFPLYLLLLIHLI